MLQQTQVDRVVPKYRRFLERFPAMRSLARARFKTVMHVWLGLGYNARALRLWQCARIVMRAYGGKLPRDVHALRSLPGIGPYTAAAVAALAFGAPTYGVDINVRRVLTRALSGRNEASQTQVTMLAQKSLREPAGDWMQALMDIGALYCTSKPKCASCPLRLPCRFTKAANSDAKSKRVKRSGGFAGSARYYRGRVVAALTRKGSLTVRELGQQVKHGFGKSDVAWLTALLQGLIKDGLILIDSRQHRVRLI